MKTQNVTNIVTSKCINKALPEFESEWYWVIGLEIAEHPEGDSYESWFQDDAIELYKYEQAQEAIEIYNNEDNEFYEDDIKDIDVFPALTLHEVIHAIDKFGLDNEEWFKRDEIIKKCHIKSGGTKDDPILLKMKVSSHKIHDLLDTYLADNMVMNKKEGEVEKLISNVFGDKSSDATS